MVDKLANMGGMANEMAVPIMRSANKLTNIGKLKNMGDNLTSIGRLATMGPNMSNIGKLTSMGDNLTSMGD